MCTVTMNQNAAKPQFALFNVVFSSDANKSLTVSSVRDTLQRMGIEITNQEIERSFSKWRRSGMLHKEGEGFKLGSY